MLEPWVIEKLREEKNRRRDHHRTPLHVPQPYPPKETERREPIEDSENSGVRVIVTPSEPSQPSINRLHQTIPKNEFRFSGQLLEHDRQPLLDR